MTNKEKLQEATQKVLLGKLVEKVIDDVDEIENRMSKHPEFILDEKRVFSIYYNYLSNNVLYNLIHYQYLLYILPNYLL